MDEMVFGYHSVIDDICDMAWTTLDVTELSAVAWAYYYFSVQFRENLQIALRLYPADAQLIALAREECATDNLSPWPDVAIADEKLDHDEFMKRVLRLSDIDLVLKKHIEAAGAHYLTGVRQVDDEVRAASIASYEAGGLESVFNAILRARHWNTPLLEGFRHFLVKHIAFDSDPDQGHGAMIKHLLPDERILCLWMNFRTLLVASVPKLTLRPRE